MACMRLCLPGAQRRCQLQCGGWARMCASAAAEQSTCCHDQHLPQALLRKYMPLAVIAGVVLLVLLLRKLLF